eukprot:scaffold1847_cov131-Isochrysis_galbana.AAC.10
MFITTNADDAADRDLRELDRTFSITLQENPEYFLGMNIEYGPLGVIKLSSRTYAHTLAANYADALAATTVGKCALRLPADAALTKAYEEALDRAVPPSSQLVKEYGSKVGALIYPVPCTRPDLAAAVGYLARALTFPTPAMNECANKVLRYFIDTASAGITFNGDAASSALEGFSDSDWSVAHSTSGYCLCFAGAPLSYTSKRQQCIALSSTEAE